MSRDDVTTWKRALLVYSGTAALLPIVAIGWMAHAAIGRIEQKASDAVADVRRAVEVVKLAQVGHEREDLAVTAALSSRVERVEDRQDSLETRLAGWRLRLDALPADRRRPRAATPAMYEGSP